MHRIDIYRLKDHGQDHGTFSRWTIDGLPFCMGVELPWKNNEPGVSCIPAGLYAAKLTESPRNGTVYELQGVPQRSDIQIHSANFAHQLKGCMAPGKEIDTFKGGKRGVTFSKVTLGMLMERMGGEEEIQVCVHPPA